MEKRNLDFECVPKGYLMCFTADCPLHDECMSDQAGQVMPDDIDKGVCVYPTACRNGQCRFFSPVRVVQTARGFGDIFRDVRRSDYSAMLAKLKGYLGTGGTYYRYKNGERLLLPEQQEWIGDLFRHYGCSGDVKFDSYLSTYVFE